ncbi:GGDEF domain-containing protein [bacterium]|nr:GGDEF domain-containing protein [bacterium]
MLLGLAVLTTIWLIGGFGAFHVAMDAMCFLAAFSLYVVGTRTYRFSNNSMLLYISVAFFYVGALDILHIFSYQGISLFPGASADLASKFWTASRALEVSAICSVPLIISRKPSLRHLHAGFFTASALLATLIFAGIFPSCYIAGVGYTPFKRWAELSFSAAAAASLAMMARTPARVEKKVATMIKTGIGAFGASGLLFALRANPQGIIDTLAHLMNYFSYIIFWTIVIEEGLDRPYDHMFKEIYERSTRDPLTGLYNRAGFDRDAEAMLAAAGAETSEYTLIVMDLDDFKLVNDEFGHPEGDEALREFAAILAETLGHGPLAARYGGDEFVVLARGGAAWASDVEARLAARVAAWREAPRRSDLGFSLGSVTRRSGPGSSFETLYREADVLMFEEKRRKHAR